MQDGQGVRDREFAHGCGIIEAMEKRGNVVMISVQMISDVGLRDTVIHNDRGDEPRFLTRSGRFRLCEVSRYGGS